MFCSGCGRQMDAGQQFCAGCGTKNPAVQPTGMVPPLGTAVPGTGVAAAGTSIAPAQHVIIVAEKSPGLAAVLSFFWAGLGQIYNGEISKGILLIVVYAISCGLMALVIGFFTTPILWIYGMVDAYKTAEKFNAGLRVGR
jgi:TM2 domain-containing membrane protein YozV